VKGLTVPESTAQGKRRIDRVLAEGFLDSMTSAPLEEIRALRADAEQEEADVSYIRRLLQGRIDILRAEVERRRGGSEGSILDSLPQILADDRSEPHGLGHHTTIEPSRVDQHRRRVEALVANVDISNVSAASDEDLQRGLGTLEDEERAQSETRHKVQAVADACAAEITRRYREGEAAVEDLLPSEPAGG
jgi:hypothetical protein